jgi:hypothetical protein
MKKFAVLLLTTMLLLSSYVPVFAKPGVPPQPGLTISAPDLAVPGETIAVTLTAIPTTKTKQLNWNVVFSKQTVVNVLVTDKKVRCRETSDAWVCNWKESFKRNKPASALFSVTLTSDGGLGLPLVLVKADGVVVGQKLIDITVPGLLWNVAVPTPMIYGERPFSVFVTVNNPANVDVAFDVSAELFHVATDRSVFPEIFGGEIYNMIGNGQSLTIFWHGIVPAGESMTMNLGTASGTGLGTFDLLVLTDILAGLEISRSSITLIQGTEAPYGMLAINSLNGMPITAGDMVAYEPTYFSNIAGQFVTEAVQSTCPIEGLPTGSVSRANVTYVKYLYYVSILPMEKPEGVTDPYTVNCNLTVNFYFWGHPETKFPVTYEFPVIVP